MKLDPIRSPKITGLVFAVCVAIASGRDCVCHATQNPPITATVQPNQDVGVAFPATMGKGPNKYSPEGGFFRVTLALSVTTAGYSFVPPTGNPPGDGTIWRCTGGTEAGSKTQTWQGAGVADSNAWSDTLFSGLLTRSGGSGPAKPTPFNASVADISIYVDALNAHSGGPTGHWPPQITSHEHFAEISEDGGFFLPPFLVRTGNDGFPQQLPADSSYKILVLRLPTKWIGNPNPNTVGAVTFTLPAGVALYHGGGAGLSGATLVGSAGIRVPTVGFPNETFAVLTDEHFIQSGPIIATFVWDSNLAGGPATGQDFARLAPYSAELIIDSENQDGVAVPTGGRVERAAKMQAPGKIIAANNGDTNMNGVPDYADLDLSGAVDTPPLVPVVLRVCFPNGPSYATVRFDYGGILPTAAQFAGNPIDNGFINYTPAKLGTLRLWNVRSAQSVRTSSDFIVTGQDYPASQLGFSTGESGVQEQVYYVEGINAGAQDISVTVTFHSRFGAPVSASDQATTTVVDPAILFNCSNGNADGSRHHLPLGVPDVDYDINAADELIKDQITSPTFWWRNPNAPGEDVTERTLVDAQPFIIRIPQLLIDQGFQFSICAHGLPSNSEIRIYPAASPGGDGGNRLLYVTTPQYAEQQIGMAPVAILTVDAPQPIQLVAGTNEFIAMAKNSNSAADQAQQVDVDIALLVADSKIPLGPYYDANTARSIFKSARDWWTEFNCRTDRGKPEPPMRDFHAIANEDYPLENLPNGTLHVDKNMKCFPLPTINPTGGGMSIPQPDNRFPPHDHYFMFVHGYNVSADDARKVNDDLYKNLFLGLGFRGHYVGFLWQGNMWDEPTNHFSLFRPNVLNALESGECLSEALAEINGQIQRQARTARVEKIDVMAHSLGNLVAWEGTRLLNRGGTFPLLTAGQQPLQCLPNLKFARNLMMVEPAVQEEAFYRQAVYTNSDLVQYNPDELRKQSWAYWFNQNNHDSSMVFAEVQCSYNPGDKVLTEAMRIADRWKARFPGFRPTLHYLRYLRFGGGIADALGWDTNRDRFIGEEPNRLRPFRFGDNWQFRLHQIPALMSNRVFNPIPFWPYDFTDLRMPIGASGTPANGAPNWNTFNASGVGWKGHCDAFDRNFAALRDWYFKFVQPNIHTGEW